MINLLLVLWLLASCASHREKTIKALWISGDVASAAWKIYDSQKQDEIIDSATSRVDGQAKLAAYRVGQARILARFTLYYHALAAAAIVNDEQSLSAAVRAAALLRSDLAALGLKL